jgi:hypothetical protein
MIDMDDFINKVLNAWIVENGRSVFFELASTPHFLFSAAASEQFAKKAGYQGTRCESAKIAHLVATNKITMDEGRKSKRILISLPNNMVFSNKHFPSDDASVSRNGLPGKDKIMGSLVLTNVARTGFNQVIASVVWQVTLVEPARRLQNTESNEVETELASAIAGMNTV